ncbi:MAG: hypothetical protein V2I33_23570 [Kangiellaceae bacterium]|nr:hypothetical protein [Kangiellaceae bacterium]
MKHEIELSASSMSKINKEHLETTEEAYGFRQKLSVLENQKSLLESEITSLRFEVERVTKMKVAAEEHLEMVKNEQLKSKGEAEAQSA